MTDKRVIALGFFDGVHIGHAALLNRTCEIAKSLGITPAVLSFDASPREFISGNKVPLINTADERIRMMKSICGIREVIIEHFDLAFMKMPWQRFIDDCLLGKHKAAHIVCGHDYRFGYGGEGNAEKLKLYCAQKGVGCDIIEKVTLDGCTVSATNIRKFLQSGDFSQAVRFLGHPHIISGTVETGNQNGRKLGFPTVNIPISDGILVPPYGVYYGETQIDGKAYPCLCNIGVHPTVGSLPRPILEAHVLGFDADVYGKQLSVGLSHFARREMRFAALSELQDQLQRDKADCLSYFHSKTP